MFGKKVKPQKGDHIKVQRGFYTHHGIYIGNGMVIHYGGPDKDMNNAMICQITLGDFADGGKVYLVQHAISTEKTVKRAKDYLGQKGYDLFENNCEHFANFCITGKRESSQVDAAFNLFDDDYY